MRAIALLLCVTLASGACATVGPMRSISVDQGALTAADRAVIPEYIRRLPIGSRIRATLANGQSLHGTLMKATDTELIIQRRTRIPEAPIEIPVQDIRAVELENPNSSGIGRAVAVGAVAAAVAVGTTFLIGALLAWD